MDSGLACNSRIQRLLWTQDYITLTEEVILLESSFVLNRRNDLKIRMVQVGLTSSALLIAEDKLSSLSPANKYLQRHTQECNSDLELFELIYLFPLANVRLSVRTHSEMIGEHVIRVRLCNGLTWYLELSDMGHREDKWREWVWWIQELEQRRKLESKLKRKKQRKKGFRGHSSRSSEYGSLDSQSITSRGFAAIDGSPGKRIDSPNDLKDGKGLPSNFRNEYSTKNSNKNVKSPLNRPAAGIGGRKQSTAHRWVHHFAEHIIDHHDETLPDSDEDDDDHGSLHDKTKHGINADGFSGNPLLFKDPLSHGKLSHRSSKMWSGSHLSVGRSPFTSRHSRSRTNLKNRMQSVLLQSGEVDSLSSLEDIESVGSLVSSNAESWTNRHARDSRKGLILSIDDLFEKTNFEAHAHGHVGRTRPMASMTRLDVLLENEAIDTKEKTRKVCISKGDIHHTSSLPDVLDGEASFIEDLPNADNVTHRSSLVYLDLENEDDSRTPHVINGHVMLLTKEEMALHELVDELRKTNHDPRLKRNHTKKEKARVNVDKTVHQKKKRRWSIVQHSDPNDQPQDHYEKSKRRLSKSAGKRMSIFFTGANRKLHILRESPHENHIFSSLRDVDSDELVNELTAIDAELFLRIHEAELVGCMWLKEDRNYRAPNVVSAIDFFKKVAGMVTKEVLLPLRSTERASVIIHFLRVAEGLREKKNYHSLRAVLAGLQPPAVYRLQDTWLLLEEQNPKEYQLWQDLLDYTHDEALSLDSDPDLDQAMRAPPCLPFLGSLLMRIIDFYSTVDISGTRLAHKLQDHVNKNVESSNGSDFESAIDIVEGYALEDDSEKEKVAPSKKNEKSSENPKGTPKLFSLFKKIANKVDSLGSKQSSNLCTHGNEIKGMREERKQHIRMLILEYAKLVAEERARISVPAQIDSKLRRKILEDFEGGNDIGDGDVDHMRSRHYLELRHMAHEHDDMPWKHQWTSEFHLHEALLQFQLSAVQYQPREKNHAVRELLLKEFHHSDEEDFKMSLERETPERFYSIHDLPGHEGEP